MKSGFICDEKIVTNATTNQTLNSPIKLGQNERCME